MLCPILNDVLFNLLVHYGLPSIPASHSLQFPLERCPFPFSGRRNHHTHTRSLFSGSATSGLPLRFCSSGREATPTRHMSNSRRTNHHIELLHPLHVHLDVDIRILHLSRMILWSAFSLPFPKSPSPWSAKRLDTVSKKEKTTLRDQVYSVMRRCHEGAHFVPILLITELRSCYSCPVPTHLFHYRPSLPTTGHNLFGKKHSE